MTRVAGQASRDADGMVRQDFDVSTRDVTTVPVQHDGEPDQHRRKVHGGSGPDVMPAAMSKELLVSQGAPKRRSGGKGRPTKTSGAAETQIKCQAMLLHECSSLYED